MTMQHIKYRLWFLFLILFFGIPLVSKMLFQGKEIYPSIVLPAGVATLKSDQENIAFSRSEAYGLDESNTLIPLDHQALIAPAPVHYFRSIMQNDFGLNEQDPERLSEVQLWWREKLGQQNCGDSVLVLREIRVLAPSMAETVVEEKRFELY